MFDERAQEVVMNDQALQSIIPRKEPDRVYGLRTNKSLDALLSRVRPHLEGAEQPLRLVEKLTTSPFKGSGDPLLFPFLLIEAKSERSADGFSDAQLQSLIPIRRLLTLQEALYSQTSSQSSAPLVWFMAYRGDTWRVYGCYLTDTKPSRYVSTCAWSMYTRM